MEGEGRWKLWSFLNQSTPFSPFQLANGLQTSLMLANNYPQWRIQLEK